MTTTTTSGAPLLALLTLTTALAMIVGHAYASETPAADGVKVLSKDATAAAKLATARQQANRDKIEAAVRVINKDAVVHSIRDIPGLGLKEVTANNSVVYMDAEGRYLFFGTLLDLEGKQNLSEIAQTKARVLALQAVPDSEKISYEPSNILHRVTVFTDISCSFCQKLHHNVAEYNDRGIAIDYVAYPRGGERNPAWAQMRSIWCAKDRNKAYDNAIAGTPPAAAASCEDPLDSHYALGESLNVEGTPAIYTENGKYIGGYLQPDQMLLALEGEKQRVKKVEDGATASAALPKTGK